MNPSSPARWAEGASEGPVHRGERPRRHWGPGTSPEGAVAVAGSNLNDYGTKRACTPGRRALSAGVHVCAPVSVTPQHRAHASVRGRPTRPPGKLTGPVAKDARGRGHGPARARWRRRLVSKGRVCVRLPACGRGCTDGAEGRTWPSSARRGSLWCCSRFSAPGQVPSVMEKNETPFTSRGQRLPVSVPR